jgi:hypothetical protein
MKPKMSAAPTSASQSEALHTQSDTCVQRCPTWHQSDCEEKRDPDERQRSKSKKENELDPNAQLEKRAFSVLRHELRRGRWSRRSGFLGRRDLDEPNTAGSQGDPLPSPLGQPH